ncbi:MAG: hypothetical protein ACPGVO_00055 [Spirulinaceae cyanobacterium]
MTIKAKRAQIQLGSRTLEGYMLPDGSYRLSQTQAAECISKPESSARRFLGSKGIKTLLGKEYTAVTLEVESDYRGQTRFNALPLNVVTAYWVWECSKGNKEAMALVMAIAPETLERRFDAAFGVERSESERNQRLQTQIDEMWRFLQDVGEGMAIDDEIRWERDRFLERLRQLGHDPYKLPETKN